MATAKRNDYAEYQAAIHALRAEVANVGVHLSLDGSARLAYSRQIQAMANELEFQATNGRITWAQAAKEAHEARNIVMDAIRHRSTPVGRAVAERIKSEGRTLNELIARKTQQLYGKTAQFDQLSGTQKNSVYGAIVRSAGKSNPVITQRMQGLSRAGRGLIFLSIAVSVYNIAVADNKVQAAGKEAALTGAGIAGGIAGGALAGLACGPGAPVCVTVGAFVGGAMAAFGVGLAW